MNVRSPNFVDSEFPRKQSPPGADAVVLNPESFHRIIALERKRTERSRKPFLLVLLDSTPRNGKLLGEILPLLSASTRETDVTGWYTAPRWGA